MELIDGYLQTDQSKDILKISVVNRYSEAPVASGFIKNIGIKDGAMASTVAHDSHNIIVIGSDDDLICEAVNLLIENKGGLSAVNANSRKVIALPVAGLMSDQPIETVCRQVDEVLVAARQLGSPLHDPFMALSFLALPVIPSLKLTDRGLVDVDKFQLVSLFAS